MKVQTKAVLLIALLASAHAINPVGMLEGNIQVKEDNAQGNAAEGAATSEKAAVGEAATENAVNEFVLKHTPAEAVVAEEVEMEKGGEKEVEEALEAEETENVVKKEVAEAAVPEKVEKEMLVKKVMAEEVETEKVMEKAEEVVEQSAGMRLRGAAAMARQKVANGTAGASVVEAKLVTAEAELQVEAEVAAVNVSDKEKTKDTGLSQVPSYRWPIVTDGEDSITVGHEGVGDKNEKDFFESLIREHKKVLVKFADHPEGFEFDKIEVHVDQEFSDRGMWSVLLSQTSGHHTFNMHMSQGLATFYYNGARWRAPFEERMLQYWSVVFIAQD